MKLWSIAIKSLSKKSSNVAHGNFLAILISTRGRSLKARAFSSSLVRIIAWIRSGIRESSGFAIIVAEDVIVFGLDKSQFNLTGSVISLWIEWNVQLTKCDFWVLQVIIKIFQSFTNQVCVWDWVSLCFLYWEKCYFCYEFKFNSIHYWHLLLAPRESKRNSYLHPIPRWT